MFKKLFLFVPVLALLLSACDFSSGELITEKMDLSEFTTLNLSIYGDVEIKQAEEFSVEIAAPKKMLDELEIDVHEGELKVNTRRWLTSADPLKIIISAPSLESIYATHNGNLYAESFQFSDLYISLTENAKLNATNFIGENLMLALVQDGQVNVSGTATNVDLKLNNQAQFYGKDFLVQNMSVNHNGVSDSEVNVAEKLVLNFLSEGNILQLGEAELEAEFAVAEDAGKLFDFDGNVLAQICTNYAADACPETCRLCPPCPECSSLLCQSKKTCDNLGFEEGWLK